MTVWTIENTKLEYLAGIYSTKEKAEKALAEAVSNGATEKDYFVGFMHMDEALAWF